MRARRQTCHNAWWLPLFAFGYLMAGAAYAQSLSQEFDFSIDAQPLDTALVQFGRQSGFQVLIASEEVAQQQTAGVRGRFIARIALERLLNGSGLQFRQVGHSALAISRTGLDTPTSAAGRRAAIGSGEAGTAGRIEASGSSGELSPAAGSGSVAPPGAMRTASRSNESPEEILVSAERFQSDVMHTAVSMTAINGDDLEQLEINGTDQLQYFVPGLSVTDSDLNRIINIRGVGSAFESPNISQGVPVYRDGLLVPPNIGDEPLWDLESVQVLRGPQGTLVGANSTGGALFINSVQPSLDDRNGYLQVAGGDYGERHLQGAINVPLASTLAIRIGAYLEQRDSYFQDLTPNASGIGGGLVQAGEDERPGNRDMLAWRASLLWQPGAHVHVLGHVDYFQNDTGNAAERPLAIRSTNINGIATLCPPAGSYFGTNPGTWSTVPASCGYAPFAPAGQYQVGYATSTLENERIWREGIEGRIGLYDDALTLRILAGAAFNTPTRVSQSSASTDLVSGASVSAHERTATYEADLIYQPRGPLQFVFGGYYWFDPAMIRALIESYSGGPPGSGPGYALPTGGVLVHGNATKLSYALFANATYQLTDAVKIEFGARETWDHNSNPWLPCASCPGGDANEFYMGVPDPANPAGALLFPARGNALATTDYLLNQGYESDYFLTWRAALDFQLSKASYLYGLVATGGKSGGIQGQQLGQNFAPEKDLDFELGWKASLPDPRISLQADLFYTRYSDMQVADLSIYGGQGSIYNAGHTGIFGAEAEGQMHGQDWEGSFTAAYVKSTLNVGSIINRDVCGLVAACSSSTGQCPPGVASGTGGCFDYLSGGLSIDGTFYPWLERVSGLQLPNSPEWQFSATLGHHWFFGGGDWLIPLIEYAYQGAQSSQIFDTPFDRLPARHNLGAKVEIRRAGWVAEGYMTNVTGAYYPVAQVDPDTQSFNAPRQFGVRVTRRF